MALGASVKRVVSSLFLGVLWVLFVASWFLVADQTSLLEVRASMFVLLTVVSTYAVFIGLWIWHNKALARHRNSRKGNRLLSLNPYADHLGVPVDLAVDILQERNISIDIVGGRKYYFASGATQKVSAEEAFRQFKQGLSESEAASEVGFKKEGSNV
jgi:hypothetical protein